MINEQGFIHSSPNIFVKSLRECVGAHLPFGNFTLAYFETRSHMSKVLLDWNPATSNVERIDEVEVACDHKQMLG